MDKRSVVNFNQQTLPTVSVVFLRNPFSLKENLKIPVSRGLIDSGTCSKHHEAYEGRENYLRLYNYTAINYFIYKVQIACLSI